MGELEILTRAHDLFTSPGRPLAPIDTASPPIYTESPRIPTSPRIPDMNIAGGQRGYRAAVDEARQSFQRTTITDRELAAVIVRAQHDHALARQLTRAVLDAARADTGSAADSPVAHREAMRRTIARLRTQQEHVLAARRRSRRRLAVLLLLRYRGRGQLPRRFDPSQPGSRAGVAVRAALTRLGMPYVWGATGPDRFDCSGLVQWAYRQAGVNLDRTTYDQIHHGFAVPRSQVQPGDLVFPHAGHVQIAIGNGQVVEAPHAGANVRIGRLGSDVVIRRLG